MASAWPALLFWPLVVLAVMAGVLAISRRRALPLVAAAVLVTPASFYLAVTPRLGFVGLFPIGAYLLAAVTARRGYAGATGVLVATTAAFFAWLALVVFTSAD